MSNFGLDSQITPRPISANIILRPQAFTMAGGVNTFTSTYPVSTGNLIVSLNGSFLNPNQFTIPSNSTVTVPSAVNGNVVTLWVLDASVGSPGVTVDFSTQVTGKPTNGYPASESSVSAILDDILKSSEVGGGADFITYDVNNTVKSKIIEILTALDSKTTIDYPVVNKAGDTGIGILAGEEFRVGQNQYFRLYYDGPSEFSGIRANSAGETVFTQGIGANNNDKFIIKNTDVWHRELGNFKDYFFPKSGFAYSGIGSYQLYLDEPLEGSTFTPPGFVGTWRCMSVVNRGRSTRTALILRIA